MQYSGNKSPIRIAQQMAERKHGDLELERRISLLRKQEGVTEGTIEEYKKNEVIRKAIKGVQKNAATYQVARQSPKKLYGGVKSRVGGNMKTLRKTNARSAMQLKVASREREQKPEDGPVFDPVPRQRSPVRNNYTIPVKKQKTQVKKGLVGESFSGATKSASKLESAKTWHPQPASSTLPFKSKMGRKQMDAIIDGIKSRYTKEKIAKMT